MVLKDTGTFKYLLGRSAGKASSYGALVKSA